MAKQLYSIVYYEGQQARCKCGYCNSPNTSYSYGMETSILMVDHYQALIDRGWRRCGCYCYKSTMDRTCCPMYTIRCEALQFKISKSQKKTLKRMGQFLRNELHKNDPMNDQWMSEKDRGENIDRNIDARAFFTAGKNHGRAKHVGEWSGGDSKADRNTSGGSEKMPVPGIASSGNDSNSTPQSAQPVDMKPLTRPHMKAKFFRRQRKRNKLLAQGKTEEEVQAIFDKYRRDNTPKTFDELFEQVCEGTNRLKMKLVGVMSEEFNKTLKVSANLFKKYQMTIHSATKNESDEKSFFNFLVKNSLKGIPEVGPPSGYGAFHEQYWLDDELIAVSVIDILPYCISSVYFFYDPAYSHLSLGTYSSLREIYLTRQLNKTVKDLKYYYMGFYIHSCPKMRYKARMRPSYLLCPETYVWCDMDRSLAKLDKQKYSRLNDDMDAIDEDGVVDISQVLLLYRGLAICTYEVYEREDYVSGKRKLEEELEEYARLVGMKCTQRLLFILN